jgi:phage tail P2-like protein
MLLPPNATALERALAAAPRLPVPEIVASLWDADGCPAAHLPWLAWALSVDEWDSAWDEATQRAVIKASVEIHRKKGTVGAVKAALSVLGHRGSITEWWQFDPPGVPHTFVADVEIDSRGMNEAIAAEIERQIIAVKPARSHFVFRLLAVSRLSAHTAMAALAGEDDAVYPFIVPAIDTRPGLHVAIGIQSWSETEVYPLETAS